MPIPGIVMRHVPTIVAPPAPACCSQVLQQRTFYLFLTQMRTVYVFSTQVLHSARLPATIILMSEAIAFDTHKFVKHLTQSGFTEKQAEALANEHVSLLNSNLATKADIATIQKEMATQKDVASIHKDIASLQKDVAALQKEMVDVRKEIVAMQKEMATRKDIEILRQEIQVYIATVKSDLLKWMFAALIAQGGLIVALVKLL